MERSLQISVRRARTINSIRKPYEENDRERSTLPRRYVKGSGNYGGLFLSFVPVLVLRRERTCFHYLMVSDRSEVDKF